MKGELDMTRKRAIKAAVGLWKDVSIMHLKQQALGTGIGIGLLLALYVGVAVAKPDIYENL